MPKPTATSIPSDRMAAFDRLIATQPDLVRKGATIPYTSLNGHMTSYLTDSGSLVLRLSPEDRARFLAEHQTGLHVAYGVVQPVPEPGQSFPEGVCGREVSGERAHGQTSLTSEYEKKSSRIG